jgi:hypothetical protein
MQCQVTYWDDHKCPPLIMKRTGRGKKRPQAPLAQAAPAPQGPVPDFINVPGAPPPKPRSGPKPPAEPNMPAPTA